MSLEMLEGPSQIVEQQRGQIAAEPVTDEDPLHNNVLAIGWHRISRHKPTARAQPIGQIVKRPGKSGARLQSPSHSGNAAPSVVDEFERTQLGDLISQPDRRLRTGFCNFPITVAAQP